MIPARLVRPIAVLVCLAALRLVGGESFFVDQGVSSSGDGRSWATAFKTIKEGVDVAHAGDEVVVAEGTYIETVDFVGKDITVRSTNPSDPSAVAWTVIEPAGAPEVARLRSGETRNAVLSGFTITAGHASVICASSSPIIRNNVIVANTAHFDQGGGISCYDASPLIVNNVIASNLASGGGAAIACEGANQSLSEILS